MKPKVLVIGIDGAELGHIKRLAELGVMPNLGKLIKNGAWGNLKSTYPPVSPAAWTSYATGKSPGKHGTVGFFRKISGEYGWVPMNSRLIPKNNLWELLSDYGKKSVIINVPMTYPPQPLDGIMISGMGTPSQDFDYTYPKEVKSEINSQFDDYIVDIPWVPRVKAMRKTKGLNQFVDDLILATEQRKKVFLYYLNTIDWDFATIVFVGTDRIQHPLWKYAEAIGNSDTQASKSNKDLESSRIVSKYYRHLDKVVGEIIDDTRENTKIFVISDHGFGSIAKQINLNVWLEKESLLHFKGNSSSYYSLLRRTLGPKGLDGLLKKLGISKLLKGNSQLPYHAPGFIDWERTQAYSMTPGGVYINVKGRDPKGTVEQGKDYERIRNTIAEKLLGLKDPETQEKVIYQVAKKEEIFSGDSLDSIPDLLVIDYDQRYPPLVGAKKATAPVFEEPRFQTGEHRLNGIFLASGKGIKTGIEVKGAEIIDLFPTILNLLDVGIPENVDGKILENIFKDKYIKPSLIIKTEGKAKKTVKKETVLDPDKVPPEVGLTVEESEQIMENLKNLGYID